MVKPKDRRLKRQRQSNEIIDLLHHLGGIAARSLPGKLEGGFLGGVGGRKKEKKSKAGLKNLTPRFMLKWLLKSSCCVSTSSSL